MQCAETYSLSIAFASLTLLRLSILLSSTSFVGGSYAMYRLLSIGVILLSCLSVSCFQFRASNLGMLLLTFDLSSSECVSIHDTST